MRVSDLLLKRQRSLFVGREEQLELLAKTVSSPEWQLLNIYGSGGIGKTTLLRMFAQTIDPARRIYLDGYSGFRSPEDFLSKIRMELSPYIPYSSASDHRSQTTEIDLLNEYALSHQQGIVLILDTFEQYGAIEGWFRDHFLCQLNSRIKVILAGRYALLGEWKRGDWNWLVHNAELQSLTHAEIANYTKKRGITNKEMTEALAQFSKGVPLALSLACEIIVRNGNATFLNELQQHQMIGHLARELTRDINDADLQQYIEAASVVWKFDQELLQVVIQDRIPPEKFREFCSFPFVIQHEYGWSLHDSVRQWIYIDFRNRMPQKFQLFRNQALDELRKRELERPDRKTEYIFEKIFLSEDDFVRNLCFQLDDSLTYRTCTEQMLDQVEQLYLKCLHSQTNYVQGEQHLESLIRPLWHMAPTAFASLWKENQLVAFCACIPLTEQTVQIFRSHPITAPAVTMYDPSQQQYLTCLAGVDPQLEVEVSGSVARALVRIIDKKGALIVNLISLPNWISYLPVLGFERAPWADSVTPGGVEYEGYQLDLRNVDFHSLVDRIVSASEWAQSEPSLDLTPVESGLRLPLEEATKLVRRALKHFSSLPLQPKIANTLRPLLESHTANAQASSEAVSHHLQGRIQEIVQGLSEGNEEEKCFHQILHFAYIKKIGTHDKVAEYLNMSTPSYYRYLRKAVRRLTYELIKENSQPKLPTTQVH